MKSHNKSEQQKCYNWPTIRVATVLINSDDSFYSNLKRLNSQLITARTFTKSNKFHQSLNVGSEMNCPDSKSFHQKKKSYRQLIRPKKGLKWKTKVNMGTFLPSSATTVWNSWPKFRFIEQKRIAAPVSVVALARQFIPDDYDVSS